MFTKSDNPQDAQKKNIFVAKNSPDVPSIIGMGTLVKGDMACPSEIQVDGKVKGNLKSRKIIVSESGEVNGSIHAEEIVVKGSVKGNVRSRKILLASKSHLQGDVLHEEMSVELGAFIEGQCQHTPFVEEDDAEKSSKMRPVRDVRTNGGDKAPKDGLSDLGIPPKKLSPEDNKKKGL